MPRLFVYNYNRWTGKTKYFDNKLIGYYDHRGFSYDSYIPRIIVLRIIEQVWVNEFCDGK